MSEDENSEFNWSDLTTQILQITDGAEADISNYSDNQSIDISELSPRISDTSIYTVHQQLSDTSIDYEYNNNNNIQRNKMSWLGDGVSPLTKKRDEGEILSLGVSVAKEERKELKKNDKKTYYKVKENCVKGIENKFTQLKPIDEHSPVEAFESVYSVVSRFDDLQESLKTNDMIGVFTIASSYEKDGSGPSTLATPVDLFHDIKSIDIGNIKLACQYFYEYGQDYHGENIAWGGEKILNSCDATLREKLIESTRGWSSLHKGGPAYLKLLMGLIVATSKKSLRSLLNKISSLKLTDFNGEDVGRAVSFLRGASLILSDNDALPSDFLHLILNIFKHTTCVAFQSYVTTIENNVDLGVMNFTADDVLRVFENRYIDMLGRTEWTPKSTTENQNSGFYNKSSGGGKSNSNVGSMMCFNCGGIGHGVKNCKLPINQEEIDIRKAIIFNKKKKDNDKKGGKKKDPKDGQDVKGGDNQSTHSDPLTTPPKPGEPTEKSINGSLLFWCSKCNKWTTHKTEGHPQDNNANPQGHHAGEAQNVAKEDIGDDSESGHFVSAAGLSILPSATHF